MKMKSGFTSSPNFIPFVVLLGFSSIFCFLFSALGGYMTWAVKLGQARHEMGQEYFAPFVTQAAGESATAEAFAALDATAYPEVDVDALLLEASQWPVVADSFLSAYGEPWKIEHRESKVVNISQSAEGDQYEISILGPGGFEAAAFYPLLNPIRKPISAQVECHKTLGDGSCGLIFWSASDVWWTFTGVGQFVRFTVEDNEFQIENGYSGISLYPEYSGSIKSDEFNLLQAIAVEEGIFFFLNGEFVFHYPSPLRGGRVGVYARTPQDVENGRFVFQNFEVRIP